MGFKVKYVLKCVMLKQIQVIETPVPQQQLRLPQQPLTPVDVPQTQQGFSTLVKEPQPQQQAPSIIDDTLPLEPQPQQQAPSIIDDTLPQASTSVDVSEPESLPQPQQQAPSIIDDTLPQASTSADVSEPESLPQPQQEALTAVEESQRDLSTLVEFLLRQQDQSDIEWVQLPQHESTTIEESEVIHPMSTLVLETFLQEQELTLVEEPQQQHLLRQELLRRHGIVDCRVQIQPLPVEDDVIIVGEVNGFVPARRKRKARRDPTYNPSRRIRRESIGWGETRELRIIPMREVRNLREDIEILNEWEAEY